MIISPFPLKVFPSDQANILYDMKKVAKSND